MTDLIKWLDGKDLGKLYLLVSMFVVVSGVLIFFPLALLYSVLGKEFSNLGPVATFYLGILLEIFVVTPLFVILFVVKTIRRERRDHR